MCTLTLNQYNDIEQYLSEIEAHLLKYEVENTFIRLMIQTGIQDRKVENKGPQFNTAVWNEHEELVFACFYLASRDSLYGSFLAEGRSEVVSLCMEEFISLGLTATLKWGHAFEPAITYMKDFLNSRCEITLTAVDEVWSHTCKEVNWTSLSLELKKDALTEFKPATEDMYDTIELWSAKFLDHYVVNYNARPSPTSNLDITGNIKLGNIYVLWYNDKPVSMAWKRRPVENGCSIGLVYTPNEERGRGYAGFCVSMLTEKLLEEFQYAQLFIIKKQDPEDNLYTRAGYKLMGASGRIYVEGRC